MTNAKIRKTYKYATDYTKDNTSSGVVPFEPEYAYHFIMGGHVDGGMGDDLETVYGTSSYGLPTTATGSADILYSRVFETDEHNDDKIITQYDLLGWGRRRRKFHGRFRENQRFLKSDA